MVGSLLMRGMLAGLIAGLLVFAFGRLAGEPQVDRAIAFEAALDEAKAHAGHGMAGMEAEPELVSRPVQASIGLLTGVVVYSAAFGGLFALVFAVAFGRIGHLSPRAVAALLALAAFLALYAIPSLKYPANPPAVGEADTIGLRTGLYFLMMLISITTAGLAVIAWQRYAARFGAWSTALIAAAGYLAVVGVAALLLPSVNEVPDGFPATVLWQFRIVSLGMQAILWATIGLVFGALVERDLAQRYRLSPRSWMSSSLR
jgi:hypothetical protein